MTYPRTETRSGSSRRRQKTILTGYDDPPGLGQSEEQERVYRALYPTMYDDITPTAKQSTSAADHASAGDEALYRLYPSMRPPAPKEEKPTSEIKVANGNEGAVPVFLGLATLAIISAAMSTKQNKNKIKPPSGPDPDDDWDQRKDESAPDSPSVTTDPAQADVVRPKPEVIPPHPAMPGLPPTSSEPWKNPAVPPSTRKDQEKGDHILSDPAEPRWSDPEPLEIKRLPKPLDHDRGDPPPDDALNALKAIVDPRTRQAVREAMFGDGMSTDADANGVNINGKGTFAGAVKELEALQKSLGGKISSDVMSRKYGNQELIKLETQSGVTFVARPSSGEGVPTLEVQIPNTGRPNGKDYQIKKRLFSGAQKAEDIKK